MHAACLRIAPLASTALIALLSFPASAQESYPTHQIRLIVPFQAGSATDAAARVVGQKMSARLGQSLIVDNRVGASGFIGAEAVARAAPDGYTILLGTVSTQAVGPSLNSNLSFDPEKDLVPIGLIGSSPYVLVTASKMPATDLPAFIAQARATPGKLTYASAGTTSMANLSAQLLSTMAKIQLTHVPYKSSAQAVTDTLNGTIDLQFGSVMPVLPHVKTGALRALAVTGSRRMPLLPDVPTVAETGLKGYETGLWMGLFAPKGTPGPVLDRLSSSLNAALADPEVDKALLGQGVQALPMKRNELTKFVRSETDKWSRVVKAAGITAE